MNPLKNSLTKLARFACASLPLAALLTGSLATPFPQSAFAAGGQGKRQNPALQQETKTSLPDIEDYSADVEKLERAATQYERAPIKKQNPYKDFFRRTFKMGMTPSYSLLDLFISSNQKKSKRSPSFAQAFSGLFAVAINSIVAGPVAAGATLIASPFIYAHKKITTAWQNRKKIKEAKKEFALTQRIHHDWDSREANQPAAYTHLLHTGQQLTFSADAVNTASASPQNLINPRQASSAWDPALHACELNPLNGNTFNCPSL